jgi:hypothetical protein
MAAAKKVFASNGFHSTTIADVADFVVEFIGNGLWPRNSSAVVP